MQYPPLDLARARILIANDDGVHAPGLKVLHKVARALAREVWVVAPETEQSAASHSLTMRRPLYLRELKRRQLAVDGTPTDCVLLAIHQVLKDRPPDLVLSGINRGGNLGEDATYSGTVAAAMEGTLLGFRSIAFSLAYESAGRVAWDVAEHWAATVLQRLAGVAWPPGILLNVNFPAVPSAAAVSGIEITRQGRHKIGGAIVEGTDPRGQRYSGSVPRVRKIVACPAPTSRRCIGGPFRSRRSRLISRTSRRLRLCATFSMIDSRTIRLVMALRSAGVTDTRVIGAIERIPREAFVPAPFRDKAYENTALPIDCHQTLSAPVVVGLMTQALDVGERMKVLEIGTGSGYHAAVLARLCRRVYTIERHRELLREAEERFAALGITNITTRAGDGTLGWPEQAPFERIVLTAAAHDVPPVLGPQLAIGGLMVLPIDDGTGQQRLWRVRRTEEGYDTDDLGEIRFVPLIAGRGD
jgi:protein-L-isoaspartate(D-aspartate) O-methyltransferase/5'/3'-nucleotidase SurE